MRRVALKHLARVVQGQAPDGATVHAVSDGVPGIPFIQGNAEFGAVHPTPQLVAIEPPRVAAQGSILLSVRAPVGELNITTSPLAIGRGVAAVEAGPDLRPDFLWWALHSLKSELLSRQVGSTYGAVDRRAVGTLPLPAPSNGEQARIADFLDRECERIQDLSRELKSWYTTAHVLVTNEIDREVATMPRVRLKHLGYRVTQGWSPEAAGAPPRDGELGVLRLSAVSTGRFEPNEAKALSDEARPEAEAYLLRDGDLLLVRASGTLRLLGTVALVEGLGSRELIYPDLVYRLEDAGAVVPRTLLAQLLRTSAGEAALTKAKRGAANNKLRLEDVRNLPIPAPAPDQIKRLIALATKGENRCRGLERDAERFQVLLAEYRDALITEAVSGNLDVTRLSEQQRDESAHAAMEGEAPEVFSA